MLFRIKILWIVRAALFAGCKYSIFLMCAIWQNCRRYYRAFELVVLLHFKDFLWLKLIGN